MLHATTLVDSLKRELKARGITYADLAARIKMSEASVKRMFSQKNFTLQRLDQVLQAVGIDFQDIATLAHDESQLISQLTYEQEKEIIGNPKIFVVAVSVLNLIGVEQIVKVYEMSEAEVVKQLLRLDKIGFLELLPNNRVKLLVSRTFHWIPNGPIQTHFRELAYSDYLDIEIRWRGRSHAIGQCHAVQAIDCCAVEPAQASGARIFAIASGRGEIAVRRQDADQHPGRCPALDAAIVQGLGAQGNAGQHDRRQKVGFLRHNGPIVHYRIG